MGITDKKEEKEKKTVRGKTSASAGAGAGGDDPPDSDSSSDSKSESGIGSKDPFPAPSPFSKGFKYKGYPKETPMMDVEEMDKETYFSGYQHLRPPERILNQFDKDARVLKVRSSVISLNFQPFRLLFIFSHNLHSHNQSHSLKISHSQSHIPTLPHYHSYYHHSRFLISSISHTHTHTHIHTHTRTHIHTHTNKTHIYFT